MLKAKPRVVIGVLGHLGERNFGEREDGEWVYRRMDTSANG